MSDYLKIGKLGEEIASKFLQKNKYNILSRNFKCKQGEIDIIASKDNEIVFCEVKTRSNKHFGDPIDAVDINKQKHIWNTAMYYLHLHDMLNSFVRFDVLEVYINEKCAKVNQVKNIFF